MQTVLRKYCDDVESMDGFTRATLQTPGEARQTQAKKEKSIMIVGSFTTVLLLRCVSATVGSARVLRFTIQLVFLFFTGHMPRYITSNEARQRRRWDRTAWTSCVSHSLLSRPFNKINMYTYSRVSVYEVCTYFYIYIYRSSVSIIALCIRYGMRYVDTPNDKPTPAALRCRPLHLSCAFLFSHSSSVSCEGPGWRRAGTFEGARQPRLRRQT